jgi:hypothetical protein
LNDQELIDGLRRELAGLRPPVDLIDRLREQAAGSLVRRRRSPVPIGTLVLAAGLAVAIAIAVGAVALVGHDRAGRSVGSANGRTTTRFVARGPVMGSPLVLGADSLGPVRFGASPARLEHLLYPRFHRSQSGYQATLDQCGVDHMLTWPIIIDPANGQFVRGEELTVLFYRMRFVGYQYGGNESPYPGDARLQIRAMTAAGLVIGDTLATGRRLYGRAFRISTAQGGTWHAGTPRGRLRGYAYGKPKHSDVSPSSRVASIDAGDVGCPALSP